MREKEGGVSCAWCAAVDGDGSASGGGTESGDGVVDARWCAVDNLLGLERPSVDVGLGRGRVLGGGAIGAVRAVEVLEQRGGADEPRPAPTGTVDRMRTRTLSVAFVPRLAAAVASER
jgi:hypothetical protein